MSEDRIVVYFVRRDLRTADNHVLHVLSRYGCSGELGYTHLLPVYVLPPDQIEISGLLKDGERSPYPQALSEHSGVWKCGLHRVKFLAESVWDMKERLEDLGSGLIIRAGGFVEVLASIVHHYARNPDGPQVSSVWMAKGFSLDERREQREVAAVCRNIGLGHVVFRDRKPLIDLRDAPIQSTEDVPDDFSTFQGLVEPLIDNVRDSVAIPAPDSLPPFPDHILLPPQLGPFEIPDTLPELIQRLYEPVRLDFSFFNGLNFSGVTLAPAPVGGETHAQQRLRYIIKQGIASRYHTLNDLEESDECLKLSGYLSLGCITSRQIHEELAKLEEGTEPDWAQTPGFGKGQNPGTKAIRVQLLRRDFIQVCSKKYGHDIFSLEGSGPGRDPDIEWKSPDPAQADPEQQPCPIHVEGALVQFQVGATGYGLIDAIMRQLLCTGYIGFYAHMLVANFLAKYAGIDWRIGAEWIASLCTDHDPSLHWFRWQHFAGVGPDPTGGQSIISPVHIAFKVDPNGSFVRKWMPELQRLTRLSNLFQVAATSPELLLRLGLVGNVMVTNPVPSDTLDLGPTSQVKCGWLHPKIFAPRPPHGLVILGPYPRFLCTQLFTPIHFHRQHFVYPPTPPGLPHPPPGLLWYPRPGTEDIFPEYYLAPHPQVFRALQHILTWLLRYVIILRILLERARMRTARAQRVPQQAVQMPNARNGEFVLPHRDARQALQDAPRAPRAMNVSAEVPRVLQVTQILQPPRRTQSVAEAQDRRHVAQELRGAPRAPATAASQAPRAPRADLRLSQPPLNAPQAPRADYRPPQAPRNAPTVPRAHVRRSQAPQAVPTAYIQPSQPSQAPLNASRAPLADSGLARAPRNAPSAPIADSQQYYASRNAYTTPRAPRAEFLPSRAPINAPRAPRASLAEFWPDQPLQMTPQMMPQMAPRAPRAMRTPPTTPPQSPQVTYPPQAPRTPEPSSLAGEADISSRYGPPNPYNAPNGPRVPTLFGQFNFNRPGTVQLMDGVPYYQALRDYHQWRTSDPAINAWYIGAPEPEDVLRHGMILRFLDSLPPTPAHPTFPPDPPQLLRRTRHRRTTRTSDDYGSSDQAGHYEDVATDEAACQDNAEPAQGRQGKRNRRGRRGRRGKAGGKGDNSDATEEAEASPFS